MNLMLRNEVVGAAMEAVEAFEADNPNWDMIFISRVLPAVQRLKKEEDSEERNVVTPRHSWHEAG